MEFVSRSRKFLLEVEFSGRRRSTGAVKIAGLTDFYKERLLIPVKRADGDAAVVGHGTVRVPTSYGYMTVDSFFMVPDEDVDETSTRSNLSIVFFAVLDQRERTACSCCGSRVRRNPVPQHELGRERLKELDSLV